MFPRYMWSVSELVEDYGHRTRLPFIVFYGTKRDIRAQMPESGEEIRKMAEANLCRSIYFISGFQQFKLCDFCINNQEDGSVEFIISLSGNVIYRNKSNWDVRLKAFDDYQNQIKHPLTIDSLMA